MLIKIEQPRSMIHGANLPQCQDLEAVQWLEKKSQNVFF